MERLHVTVLYLGDRAGNTLPQLRVTGAAVARNLPAGDLQVEGCGRFGSAVWLGVTGPWLAELRQDLVRRLGVPAGPEHFRPHLTVARRPRREPDREDTAEFEPFRAIRARWRPRELTLVRSGAGGQAGYTIIGGFPFA